MKIINQSKVKWSKYRSPRGKYAASWKQISELLGDKVNAWPKDGHPFNLELNRVPPGKSPCPYHSHTTQWEMFIILSGRGTVRANGRRYPVKAGDVFIHPPGRAHQIINTSRRDLVFYIVADNPPVDIFRYPDSGKWGLRPYRKNFRMTETKYYEGEE